MNKELILKSDVLDILFENRNKNYGAYQLRKFYDNRLLKAMGLMMGAVVVLSAFTFLPKKKVTYAAATYIIPDNKTAVLKEPDKKPDPPKEVVKQPQANQQIFVNKIVIVPNRIKTDSIRDLKPNVAISNVTVVVPVSGDPGPAKTVVTAGGSSDPVELVKKVIDNTTPVYDADVMPAYPGGMDALRNFLQRNLHNPKDMEEGELVNVKVSFVVGYDGKLQRFEVLQDGGDEFNKEVIRVLKKMPEWIPGKSNGENVSVYYNIPVKFIPAE